MIAITTAFFKLNCCGCIAVTIYLVRYLSLEEVFISVTKVGFRDTFKEALSVLMLCAPSNRQSYDTKIVNFEYFHVLSVFS